MTQDFPRKVLIRLESSVILRQLGKQDNCRVAVSVSLATEEASIPAAYRLYLPEAWANDKERRKQAGVPKELSSRPKPDIALTQIRSLSARMCRVV